MMTISVGWMVILGGGAFLLTMLVGIASCIYHKDSFYMVPATLVGIIAGLAGIGIGGSVDDSLEKRKARELFKAEQRNILTAMPEAWQQLNKLLNQTQTEPIRKAYVKDFVKSKTEPDIPVDAYEIFYATTDCTNWRYEACNKWKSWLAEQLMPFVIIDTKAAIARMDTDQ